MWRWDLYDGHEARELHFLLTGIRWLECWCDHIHGFENFWEGLERRFGKMNVSSCGEVIMWEVGRVALCSLRDVPCCVWAFRATWESDFFELGTYVRNRHH